MEEPIVCPECRSPYGYNTGSSFMCPECGHEWLENATTDIETGLMVVDANGTRLLDGDHNIDCRIDGFGQMALKSEFVRKA